MQKNGCPSAFSVVPVQQEKISDLNGNHGGKYRSNQIEEAGNIIHGKCNSTNSTQCGGNDGCILFRKLLGNRLKGNSGGIGIQPILSLLLQAPLLANTW